MGAITTVEATADLASLVERVTAGDLVTITRAGVPVARLVPVAQPPVVPVSDIIVRLTEFRRGQTLGGIPARALIEEGRR